MAGGTEPTLPWLVFCSCSSCSPLRIQLPEALRGFRHWEAAVLREQGERNRFFVKVWQCLLGCPEAEKTSQKDFYILVWSWVACEWPLWAGGWDLPVPYQVVIEQKGQWAIIFLFGCSSWESQVTSASSLPPPPMLSPLLSLLCVYKVVFIMCCVGC